MQRILIIFGLVAAVLCPLSLPADRRPNEDRGRVYMREICKNCHTRGAVYGEITPLNKTSEQWRAHFSTGRHDHGKNPLTSIMPEEKLREVENFLVSHSADSLKPETCGR
jgi:hypothetical protein